MPRFARYAASLIVLTFCPLFVATPARAQAQAPAPGETLTLDKVLELAQARSESVAIAQLGVVRAGQERVRARSALLPQLNLNASYERALASEFEEVFESFRGSQDGGDTGGFEDLPFGRENTWRAQLSFTQNLFSGGRIGARTAMAAAGIETAELAATTARAQVLFEVTQAYYDAALSSRLVAIAEAAVEQASSTLRQAQAAFDAGTQPEFEVLRARVSRDTQNPVLIRQRVNREIALLRLKQMLDLPAESNVQLADALADEALPPPPAFAPRVASVESRLAGPDAVEPALQPETPVADRSVVRDAAVAVRLREAAHRAARAERLPSVSLFTNYGRVTYPSGPLWGFDSLRTNWTLGASMQVPLLTGGRLKADERVAESNVEEARLRLRQAEELAAVDTRAALAELVAARAAWQATAGTVQQATRAYEIADVRYRAGVSTQLELADSRLLLQQAEANRAQAARDYQVARARVALLPDLPLGAGGTGTAPLRLTVPRQQPPAAPEPQGGGGTQIRTASMQTGAAGGQ